MEKDQYIRKWLDGTLTDQEREVFRDSQTYHELMKMDQALKHFKAPELKKEVVRPKLDLPKSSNGKIKFISWQHLSKVAAALVVGIVLYYSYTFLVGEVTAPEIQAQTLNGETIELLLPDSSHVVLNAASSLSYDSEDWTSDRSVHLDGEGYFKVKKGSRFTVITPVGEIAVVGTQFNVRSRAGYFEVICYEGSVEVAVDNNITSLNPNQMLQFIRGISLNTVDHSETYPSWIHLRSSFFSVPYREVLAEFERQYGANVITEGVDLNQLFTGSFIHGDRDLALQAITDPLHLNISFRDSTILLYSED